MPHLSTPATQDHPFAQNRRVSRVLGQQALNRATLARQLLLERAELAPAEAVHHLVGLQSQVPHNPYTGLWSRLAGFRPASLSDLLDRMPGTEAADGTRIFSVAYGEDAEGDLLKQISTRSNARSLKGDAGNIDKIYHQISAYF